MRAPSGVGLPHHQWFLRVVSGVGLEDCPEGLPQGKPFSQPHPTPWPSPCCCGSMRHQLAPAVSHCCLPEASAGSAGALEQQLPARVVLSESLEGHGKLLLQIRRAEALRWQNWSLLGLFLSLGKTLVLQF